VDVVLVPVLELVPVPVLLLVSEFAEPPWLELVEFDVMLGDVLGMLLVIVVRVELEPVDVSYWSLVPPSCLQPSSAQAAHIVRIVFFIF
jgi:hypothetical protein